MIFANPIYLVVLVIIPVVILVLIRRKRFPAVVHYADLQCIREIKPTTRVRFAAMMPWLTVVALILMVLALARPQIGVEETRVAKEGIDIILAVDVSSSMLIQDFNFGPKKVDRLEAVKIVAGNFMKNRPDDRIGVVVFSGRPYLLAPLTWDHDWALLRLSELKEGMLVDSGTAIGSALAVAANRLRESKAKSKVIILLTDGINNSGTIMPETAAKAIRQLGIVLYTVGAGIKGEIDADLMTRVATMTGGRYFWAGNTDSLSQIFDRINRMAKTSYEAPRYGEYIEVYPYLLIISFLILVTELILSRTVLRRIP